MVDFGGKCLREGGLRYNSAISMSSDLLHTFTSRIVDLYKSSQNIMDSFYEVRASMFSVDITVTDVEAKGIELQSHVERLEAKGKEVEALLRRIDLDAVGRLLITLPMYRDLTEAQARDVVLDYCEKTRLKFYWMRPQALEIKKLIIAGTVSQVKRTRIEIC